MRHKSRIGFDLVLIIHKHEQLTYKPQENDVFKTYNLEQTCLTCKFKQTDVINDQTGAYRRFYCTNLSRSVFCFF